MMDVLDVGIARDLIAKARGNPQRGKVVGRVDEAQSRLKQIETD
jgi:hypothetical protein